MGNQTVAAKTGADTSVKDSLDHLRAAPQELHGAISDAFAKRGGATKAELEAFDQKIKTVTESAKSSMSAQRDDAKKRIAGHLSEADGNSPVQEQHVLEVQGWFPDDAALQATIDGLRRAGYVRANASLGGDEKPPTPIDEQQMRILTTSTASTAGAMLAGVAVLASGAAIPLAFGAAMAAALGLGALTECVGQKEVQKHIDERNRHGAAGTLMLAMHVNDQAHADEVTRIMRDNGSTRTKSVTRADQTLVSGIRAASCTG